MIVTVLKSVENIVGKKKVKNAAHLFAYSPFPSKFSTCYLLRFVKPPDCEVKGWLSAGGNIISGTLLN